LKGCTALFRRQVLLTLDNPDDYFSWHARCRFVDKANQSSITDNPLEVASLMVWMVSQIIPKRR